MSLALLSPSTAAAAASTARATAPMRAACTRASAAPAWSARQTTSLKATRAAAATASLLRAVTAKTSRSVPAAAAAASEPPSSPSPGSAGRVAERGDMVTVHYTLYEEILDSSSASSSGSSGSSAAPAAAPPSPPPPPPPPETPLAAVVEDPAKKKKYQVLDSSREGDGRGEPLTFEVGAGDVFGNELFQAFDEVVRGRAAGDTVRLTCPSPPAWDPELLFRVPGDHPEIERMRGRYKNVGGLAEGLVVELSNGKRAVVVAVSDEEVTLDANDMLAGGSGGERVFELELVRVEPGKETKKEEEE